MLLCSVTGYDASGRVDDLAAQQGRQCTSIAIGEASGLIRTYFDSLVDPRAYFSNAWSFGDSLVSIFSNACFIQALIFSNSSICIITVL